MCAFTHTHSTNWITAEVQCFKPQWQGKGYMKTLSTFCSCCDPKIDLKNIFKNLNDSHYIYVKSHYQILWFLKSGVV